MRYRYIYTHFQLILFLTCPQLIYSLENPNFRFWTAEDGLYTTFVLYVNIGPQGNVIANGAGGCSLLDGYRVKSFPPPYSFACFQQEADGTIWSFLTDILYSAIT